MPKSGKIDVSRVSQEHLAQALLESAPDAMVVADRYGTIVMVNKQTEQLFGYRRDELIGKTLQMLVPARFREQHSRHSGSDRAFGSYKIGPTLAVASLTE
jgi:PAS domain S-box-containing protein